jgi:hypothetical protein
MPRNYVKQRDRRPGGQYRPNGTEVKRATVADLDRAAGTGSGEEAGLGEGTGEGIEAGTGTGTPEGTAEFTDPRTAAGSGSGEGTGDQERERTGSKRKVGRPATAQKKAKVQTSLEGIEGILLSVHMMGATLLKVPEMVMSEPEAKNLSEAIARVASHYDVGASEKTLAWVNLAVVAGGLYGTRAYAYHLRLKAEAAQKQIAAQQQQQRVNGVHPFPAAGSAAAV